MAWGASDTEDSSLNTVNASVTSICGLTDDPGYQESQDLTNVSTCCTPPPPGCRAPRSCTVRASQPTDLPRAIFRVFSTSFQTPSLDIIQSYCFQKRNTNNNSSHSFHL